MHNPCTTRMPAIGERASDRPDPDQASVGACRIARNAAPKRSAFCGPMPWMRSRSSRVAGRVSAILASVVAVQSSGLPSPSAPRESATWADCSRSKTVAAGRPARLRRAGWSRRRRGAGDDREEGRAEALELHRADAGDAGEIVEGRRPARGHLVEGAVGEDHVGRHARGVGQRPAAGLERGEEALVLLGHLGDRRALGCGRRRCGRCRRAGSGSPRRAAPGGRPR